MKRIIYQSIPGVDITSQENPLGKFLREKNPHPQEKGCCKTTAPGLNRLVQKGPKALSPGQDKCQSLSRNRILLDKYLTAF